MNKSFVAVVAAVGLFSTGAYAADMRMPMKAPPPIAAAPVWTWTGFYIGVNGGYSWGRSRTDTSFTTFPGGALVPTTLSNSTNLTGGVAGGQIGYNWQMNSWLIGLEGDGQWSGERGSFTFLCPGGACLTALTFVPPGVTSASLGVTQKIDAFGTFRGRLGMLVTPEVLLYGTGGLAVGSVTSALAVAATTAAGGAFGAGASVQTTRVGWTAGAGIEGMFARNWSAKLEYLYMDLGRFNNSNTLPTAFVTVANSSRVTDNILRAGINYHF